MEKNWKHPLYGRWKKIHANAAYAAEMKVIIPALIIPRVCERWLGSSCDDPGFSNFIEDVGLPPFPRAALMHIDLQKDWCPENMRWVTKKETFLRLQQIHPISWVNWLPSEMRGKYEKFQQEEALRISKEVEF